MHKWRLLLLLVLSLLQPILSEYILIDGRQCSSVYSSQGKRSHGKYPFDKPVSDTLRLNTLRENRQDGQRYGERNGIHDSRFSDSSRLEHRTFTTYDRGHNIYERRLYRTERDGRRTFDRDIVCKQREIIKNNDAKRDTSPYYARTSQEKQEREIRTNFASNQTPLQARHAFNEKLITRDLSNTRRPRNENLTSNLNNVDRTIERTGRNLRIRQNVENTNENNGDNMFRHNVRKRDLTTHSRAQESINEIEFMTERWKRNINKKQTREISKSFERIIARTQYRSKAERDNGDRNYIRHSRYNIGDPSTVSSKSQTLQRDVKHIRNEHIISSLDIALKSFERNNQGTARSTPSRRTNVSNKSLDTRNTEKIWFSERQSGGQQVRNRVMEQYDDMRRSPYKYARNNPERQFTVVRLLQKQNSRSINAQDGAIDRTNTRIEKTYLSNKILLNKIHYQRNLREVTRRIFSQNVSRNQNTRNMYDRVDTRNQERHASNNFDRSDYGDRDLRQQRTKTSTSEYAVRRVVSILKDERQQNAERLTNKHTNSRRDERNTNVRDSGADRLQGKHERVILDRQILARHDVSRENSNRNHERYARDFSNINKYLIDYFDGHREVINAKSVSKYNVHREDFKGQMDKQMSHNRKTDAKIIDEQQNGFRSYERLSKDNRHTKMNFSQSRSRRISDTRKGNEIKQNINKRSTDVREKSASANRDLHRSDVKRITDTQIIRSREDRTLLERDSKYMKERTVSLERVVRESDVKRITHSAERNLAKDERRDIQYNTRVFKINNGAIVTFAEHVTRLRNAVIKNKPASLIREERTTVSNKRIDSTNNERFLREPIYKRTISSRQERQTNARVATNEKLAQSRDVRNVREREQTHLGYNENERSSKYHTRDRSMFAKREVAKREIANSRSIVDDNFKYEQELQRADVTKERLRMINDVRYSRIRERTAQIEQNSYLGDERKYNKGTDRNIESNTARFVRDSTRERVIARERREQNAIRFTDKQIARRNKNSGSLRDRTRILDTIQPRQSNLYITGLMTESSLATLWRTDERNYRAEVTLHNRNYEQTLDLYREARSKIRNRNGYLNNNNVERDHFLRQSESAYKRNIFGNVKKFIAATSPGNFSPALLFWSYLLYAIQGIYIFGVFMQIFRQNDAKSSFRTRLAVTPHIKVD